MSKICPLPWISMETMPNGYARPCCLYNDPIPNIHLAENTLTEAFNSQTMKDLRKEFKAGKKPKACSKCWDLEKAGGKSKRMYSLELFGEPTKTQIQFLDLKLGNICNLKCRICGSWSSSQWASENIKQKIDGEVESSKVLLKQGTWPRNNKRFWEDLETLLPNITYMEFTGGEPFLIQEHFDLLKLIVEEDYAKNIKIHYNTNGTTSPGDAMENIWPAFREVEIAFSVDDVQDRFEYQRSGAKWGILCENIHNITNFRENNNNHLRSKEAASKAPSFKGLTTQICCTISVFNIYYLEELCNWINTQNFDYEFFNMLHGPKHFCINALKPEVKLAIKEKLEQGEFTPKHKREIKNIINFMMNNSEIDFDTELFKLFKIDQVDKIRGVSFKETHPEMWKLLYE